MSTTLHVPDIQKLLIVATSGRLLAQFSVNAGHKPLVIDRFSDSDTQELALECIKVNSLALEHVKTAFFTLKSHYTITHVIYGSGLERNLNTLKFLHQNLIVLGNTPDVFSAIQNKSYFFSRLNYLQIPYPEISFQAPDNVNDWLLKPMQGEGGLGITKYFGQSVKSGSYYWQKIIYGIPMSVLFITDGEKYIKFGFHKQLITSIENYDFVFSGVISQLEISKAISNTVSQWIGNLVSDFSLKGINSLDFIVKNDCCYALEVNARPSVSMQLYTDDLISEQIKCFMGEKLIPSRISDSFQAYKIIFSESDGLSIRKNTLWPEWVVDIPHADSFIHTGMPICSIIANGKNEQQVLENLQLKQQIISKLLQ